TRFSRAWSSDVCSSDLYGVTALPGARPAGMYGGSGLAVSAYSLNRTEALRLVEFLTGDAEQIRGAADGARIPTRPALYSHPEVRSEERRGGTECSGLGA